MSVSLEIPFRTAILSPRSEKDTLAYLADWQRSIGDNFKGLESFRETRPGVYDWKFEEVGYQKFTLLIQFSTKASVTENTAAMSPQAGPHKLSLRWTVKPGGADLDLAFTVELPVPALMKGLVAGFARTELTKLLERYAANVEKALAR